MPAGLPRLFAVPIRSPAHRSRRLDPDATLEHSARRAGLYTPVLRVRGRVPDLVVLLEVAHQGDQMAGLGGELIARLCTAGLPVHRYDWRGSPHRVVGPDGRWRPLADCLARHAGAQLLLIGEPAALLDPEQGRLRPWTRPLLAGREPALLLTRRPPLAWSKALDAAGFALAECSRAGLQSLVLYLMSLDAPDPRRVPWRRRSPGSGRIWLN